MTKDMGKIALLAEKVAEKKQERLSNGEIVEHKDQQYKLPYGYFAKGTILKKEVWKGKDEIREEVFICRQLPLVTKMYINIEENEKYYDLEWIDNHRRYKQLVKASEISTRRELLKLSDASLAVTDQNASELIRYFDLFILNNDIETQPLVTRLGQTKSEFIHPLNSKVKIQPPDVGEKQLIRAFEANGTSQEWIENVLSIVKEHPKALIMVLGSFASVILKDLKLSPFIIDMAGRTSAGKTSILRAAASVWGTEHLVNEWNLTKVAAERKSAFLNSFPILLDDTRKANKHHLQDFVYQFSGGRSKGRGSIAGSQREETWTNVLLSTGENSLVDYADKAAGISARVLPLKGSPFEKVDYEFFNSLYTAIEVNYGQIGLEFLEVWQTSKDDEKPLYEAYRSQFQKLANGNEVITRMARHYAALVVVADMLNRHFQAGIDMDLFEKLFDEINQDNAGVDKPKQMLGDVLTKLESNRNKILGKYTPIGDIWAIYKGDTLYLKPQFLKECLEEEMTMTRAEWLRRGYSKRYQNNGKTVDYKQIKHNGEKHNGVEISYSLLEELGFSFEGH